MAISQDAHANRIEINAGVHKLDLEVNEQHPVTDVVEARIHQDAFQPLTAQEPLQEVADRLLHLSGHRMVEIALVGEGRHSDEGPGG